MTQVEKESLISNLKELCNMETTIMYIDYDFSLGNSIECEGELNQISSLIRNLKDKIKVKLREKQNDR